MLGCTYGFCEFIAHRRNRRRIARRNRASRRVHRNEATSGSILRLHPVDRRRNCTVRAASDLRAHIEQTQRRFVDWPGRARRRSLDRNHGHDPRGQHLRAAPARTNAQAGFRQSDLPRLRAFRRQRANKRVAIHRNLKPASERRAVDRGRARTTKRGNHGKRLGARDEIRVQRSVIKRINLREISARDKHARRCAREHEALRLLCGDLDERRLDLANQPTIEHHNTTAWFLGIRLQEHDMDAVADFVGKHVVSRGKAIIRPR